MTTLKTSMLAIALLAGGTSLAMAQNGLPTGGYPPVMGGAAGTPGFVPAPVQSGATAVAPGHHTTKHHKKIYMSAKH